MATAPLSSFSAFIKRSIHFNLLPSSSSASSASSVSIPLFRVVRLTAHRWRRPHHSLASHPSKAPINQSESINVAVFNHFNLFQHVE